jgi:hypothetical protein
MQMVQRNSRKEFPSNPQGCREIPTASLALQNGGNGKNTSLSKRLFKC